MAKFRQRLQEVEVKKAVGEVAATMHGVTPGETKDGAQLGPIPTAEVELEGDHDEALLDTSSPVTIVPLGYLLQLLAKKRAKSKSPDEWKRMVTSGNEWWRDDWSPLC